MGQQQMIDKSRPVRDMAEWVESILSRMTLAQKVGQMTQPERMEISPAEVRDFHIGSVLSGAGSCPGANRPEDWINMADASWNAATEQTESHLPIPILYGVDAIHGNANVLGATVFPHNIGLGAANDADLIERIARATALEILATGVDWTFAPTLAVARNDKWGRTYESYSEDPAIVTVFADRFVSGMQGNLGEEGVLACAKHWIGDGGTWNGVDQGETRIGFDELKRVHMTPYLRALAARVQTIMVSFNSWNGDKCHGHGFLVTELLKNQLGFDGFVISDWDGIDYLSKDYAEAIALSVNAGVDMFMISVEWREFIRLLIRHVESDIVPMERIDDAVRRILTVKHRFGLFEKPAPAARKWSGSSVFGCKDHRDLAREAVRKSLVLLKNEQQLLPLQKQSRILVAGRNADNRGAQCGGFTVEWQGTKSSSQIEGGTSIWEAIRDVNPTAQLSLNGSAASRDRHDVALVVIGEDPYAEGMGDIRESDDVVVQSGSMIRGTLKVLEPYGQSLALADLHPEDLEVIEKISAQGIPVVAVMLSGRPLVVEPEMALATAFIAAWLPGSEASGIADVLFGDYNFTGRLAFSWPTADGRQQNVGDDGYQPLFPYGFGLSY